MERQTDKPTKHDTINIYMGFGLRSLRSYWASTGVTSQRKWGYFAEEKVTLQTKWGYLADKGIAKDILHGRAELLVKANQLKRQLSISTADLLGS